MVTDPASEHEAFYALPPSGLLHSTSPTGTPPADADPAAPRLGDVLRSLRMAEHRRSLTFAIGTDAAGRPVAADLAELPHLLVTGTTGSGKSTALHALLVSLLMRTTPDEARLVLVDTRGLELPRYNGAPHLITPVITKPQKAVEALRWLTREIALRYDDLAGFRFRHVDDFNRAPRAGRIKPPSGVGREHQPYRPYPRLVVVVDDIADMLYGDLATEAAAALALIAGRGRIVGVHAVLMTQSPGIKVPPPAVAANMPARLAFASADFAGSYYSLGTARAQQLAAGHALFRRPGPAGLLRVRGAVVTEAEVKAVVGHCATQPRCAPIAPAATPRPPSFQSEPISRDLLLRAAELVVSTQFGSTSMIQRKLRVGFGQAQTIMDLLESHGIVGPLKGAKPRDVLVRPGEIQRVVQALDSD